MHVRPLSVAISCFTMMRLASAWRRTPRTTSQVLPIAHRSLNPAKPGDVPLHQAARWPFSGVPYVMRGG
jgi:hypothetical protein